MGFFLFGATALSISGREKADHSHSERKEALSCREGRAEVTHSAVQPSAGRVVRAPTHRAQGLNEDLAHCVLIIVD